jgi:putative ABC transport system permease protein
MAAQLAVALMLLIGAGLLVKSSLLLGSRDLHFEPDHVLMFDWTLPVPQRPLGTYHGAPYFEIPTSPAVVFAQALDRLRTLSGVESAGGSSYPAVNSLIIPTVDVRLEPTSSARPGRVIEEVAYFLVTPGYFETIHAPVLSGRSVSEGDTRETPWVLVVNESAARTFWPAEDPVGKRVRLDTVPEEQVREVVGVVPDIPLRHAEVATRPMVYASYLQQPGRWRAPWRTLFGNMTFVVRTTGDPNAALPAVRQALAGIDPDRPVASAGTVRQHLDAAMRQFRYLVVLMTVLACTAVTLAGIGIYGTVAYTVGQRTSEIGIRKALGAQPWNIAILVARRAARVVIAGLAAGLAGALILTRLIASQLWGTASTDPEVYAVVSLLFVTTVAAACALPVRRAINADPAAAIRRE